MFSKACEYGIKALLYIASKTMEGDQRVKVGEIAKEIAIPEAFTGKILSTLSQHGLVASIKGPYGGYYLPQKSAQTMTLIDVVKAIDGHGLFEGCALGLKECSHINPCPMHHQFVSIRALLKKSLSEQSVFELTKNMTEGHTVLV